MPRIIEDPTRAVCPNFEHAEWDFCRQPMIEAHMGDHPLTLEEAAQRMKDAWTRVNDLKVAAWNAQREQDREEQEGRDRLVQEEEDARRDQQQREAEEQRREVERKKPKIGEFNEDREVCEWIEPRPAQYALNKINNLEYVELDYFTIKGCREATTDTNKSISQDTLAFTQVEGNIAIRPLAAIRPSKHIRNDHDLNWEEMMDAKNTMLNYMALSGVWPEAHAKSVAYLFYALDTHPRKAQPNGKQALVTYQSRVRREWFDALKRGDGFNIGKIRESLLVRIAEEIDKEIQDRNMEQVRRHPSISRRRRTDLLFSIPPRPSSKTFSVLPSPSPPPPLYTSFPCIPPCSICRCRVLHALFPCRAAAVAVMTLPCHVFIRKPLPCRTTSYFPAAPSSSTMTLPCHVFRSKTADMPHNAVFPCRAVFSLHLPCRSHSPRRAVFSLNAMPFLSPRRAVSLFFFFFFFFKSIIVHLGAYYPT